MESLAAAALAALRGPRNTGSTRPPASDFRSAALAIQRSTYAPWVAVALGVVWAGVFCQLALARHASGGSHAEDLGFTDQVIWGLAHGRWFEMTVYQGATWNTELDIARVGQPNSLLAFHVEPLLLLLGPLYALGGDVRLLLILQAGALALGAVPAYCLGARAGGSPLSGLLVAAVYLLSPLGQWAALDDFHTSALATPLLVLAVERLSAERWQGAYLVACLSVLAREDVALTVAALGLATALAGRRRVGVHLALLGTAFTLLDLLVIRAHSGSASPLAARYGPILAGGVPAVLDALQRATVVSYLGILGLTGGWLAVCAPHALLPAVPVLGMNVLSASLWMASGRAHYSALVLPFVVVGVAAGLGVVRARQPAYVPLVQVALLAGSLAAYLWAGAGPLGGTYAPATPTAHARLAQVMVQAIPPAAGVTASSPLVPHVSQRARVYVFPAMEDAEYVALDVTASSAPTSPGDVYLRVRTLLAAGGWRVAWADDGLLLLARDPTAPPSSPDDLPAPFYTFLRPEVGNRPDQVQASFLDGQLTLISAEILPGSVGALEPDGPRGILRTTWVAHAALPAGTTPRLTVTLASGEPLEPAELAAPWWHPLHRWPPGLPVRIDIPNVPLKNLGRWELEVESPGHT